MSRQMLVCMRTADMRLVHPLTDFSRRCSKCKKEVGIYPSGQAVIEHYGEANIEIVCNRCAEKQPLIGVPAPGALEERSESIPNPRKP